MQDFKKLLVWQKAHELALAVYRASESFPTAERYGLTAQVRSSASSVPTNIAEGCGRGSNADLTRFLHMSTGSLSELEYQLILARDLGLLTDDPFHELNLRVHEVRRMLVALMSRTRSNGAPSRKLATRNSELET